MGFDWGNVPRFKIIVLIAWDGGTTSFEQLTTNVDAARDRRARGSDMCSKHVGIRRVSNTRRIPSPADPSLRPYWRLCSKHAV